MATPSDAEDGYFSYFQSLRSDEELTFASAMVARGGALQQFGIAPDDTQTWPLVDEDGPWLLMHVDITSDGVINDVLRVDFDPDAGVVVGHSSSLLNSDAETRLNKLPGSEYVTIASRLGTWSALADEVIRWIIDEIGQDKGRGRS